MSAGRHRRGRRARRAQRRRATVFGALVGVVALLGGAALVSALAIDSVGESLRGFRAKEIRLGQNTQIYDKDGRLLGRVAGVTNRTEVTDAQIPEILEDATVAIEDKRFYDHDGVDYYRLVGAAVNDVRTRSASQGGSTITMQLMKNLYNPGAPRTLDEKVEEAYLALQFEKRFSKREILVKYLNGVFYGNNALGVQAASLTYFDRDVGDITLPQAALLAGLPQAPSSYNPFANPQAAKARRNLVLEEMAAQGYISREHAERAKRSGLALKRGDAYRAQREGYFFEYVRQVLIERYGEQEVQKGGFKVYTTIDTRLQQQARRAIEQNLGYSDDPDAAVVMLDSRTGYIRAMASSQVFSEDNAFNLAAQAERQSGSTFKTFVLTRAIEQGIDPDATSYTSRRLLYEDPVWGSIDVSTYSDSYRGPISIRSATLSSDNSVYTQMTLDVGPQAVVDTAYKMGIPRERELPVYPSVGLGAGDVTPLDMAVAYAPLSNGGFRVAPLAIQKIVRPDGREEIFAPDRAPVISDGVAYEVTQILRDNITGGTGTAADIPVPAAGKTGTTDDFGDAWFVGYTPRYSTAVWVGYPNSEGERRYMTSVHGIAVAGGTFPAQIWGDFMGYVVDRDGGGPEFPEPEEPVEWVPFSSDFTEYAARARAQAATAAAAAAQARAQAEAAREEEEREEAETAPGAEAPPGAARPPGPAPAPAAAPTPAPAPATPAPATP